MTVNFGDGTTIDSGGSLGKILQVVSTTKSDRESFSISSSSNYGTKFGTVGSFNPSITVSGSNKVYVTGHICLSSTSSDNIGMQLLRGSTVIGQGDSHGSTRRGIIGNEIMSGQRAGTSCAFNFLDTPGAGTHTYTMDLYGLFAHTSTIHVNRGTTLNNNNFSLVTISVMTLLEVSA